LKRFWSLPWRKWFKHLFVTAHFLLYSLLLAASALLYIAFRPDGLELVNTYVLKPLGIRYTHAEGSLLDGFTLHNLRTDNTEAKTFVLKYNLVKILEGEHTVDSVRIDGLRLQLDDFKSDGTSIWPFPMFKLREVAITNLQLISTYPVELDLHGKNGTYDGDVINFASLNATLKSRYASGAIHGTVHNNSLSGIGDIYPNAEELAPYSGRFTSLPKSLRLEIKELSDEKALLHTQIATLASKQDPTLRADSISLDFNYRYENDYFDIDTLYTLIRGGDSMKTKHHLRYALSGKTTTEFDGIITSKHPLPSNALHGELSDDTNGFIGKLTLDGTTLAFASKDYDRFDWKLSSAHQDLKFIPALPGALRTSPLQFNAKGSYQLSADSLKGTADAAHEEALFRGMFSSRNGYHVLDGNLTLPGDAPLWKNWAHKPPKHLTLSLSNETNASRINISGDALNLSAVVHGEKFKGSGDYLGTFFNLNGSLEPTRTRIDIESFTPSLFATVSHIHPIDLYKGEYYDAEMRAKTSITLSDTLSVQSDIEIPWYAAVLDTQRAYGGTDGRVRLAYRDGNITVENYRLEIANHPIKTDKSSHLHINSAGGVTVDEFWIFDTLLLNGTVNSDLSASLRLYSERFSYQGPEGSAHASADMIFVRDAEANQNLSGKLKILDSTITYLPFQEFKVMDDDIIIVQDVRPPSHRKFSMNVHITAEQPIRFKTKELDLNLVPDLTLWKEPTDPIQILGMITIPSGTAESAGKSFDIKHSEIYFGGDLPLNPYLNITIGHEVDYNKILIYVTHTLDSPIFLFSSDPVMSQNDIMSYLLFGGPANSLSGGDSSTSTVRADATNFMLGAGLKGLINGATKLQIDRMNILTTAEGGMGFEVGARLNKDLRVLYKNDTVSSVLVQYSINKWLRLDADIHELGQGVNAIYIKDFRDFLPHNKPTKK